MAYFPAAYKKVFLGRGFQLTTPLSEYSGGDFGFFDAKTWTPIDVAGATMSAHPNVVLVLGNPDHTVDKIGPNGGYLESVKSQVINARNITRFWKVSPRSASPHIVQVGWNGVEDSTTAFFTCGKTYKLRIDLKGSAVLRFLGHNLYRIFQVTTGCCANAANPDRVDPITVMLDFAKQINADPLFSPFVHADAVTTDGTSTILVDPGSYEPLVTSTDIDAAIAALRLTISYTDTLFTNCSFDPTDHYDVEPLMITSAQLVNDEAKSCADQWTFTVIQQPSTAQGTGDQVLRDYILSLSYRQEPYPKNPRLREVLDINLVAGHVVRSPSFGYINYYLLHTVPRKSNPTGIYDQDQYLIQLSVPEDTTINFFESWMQSYLASAGNGVTMEDLSGTV